jgi:hypothetical protein
MDTDTGPTAGPGRVDLALAGGLSLLSWLVYLATLTPSLSFVSPDGNELATIPAVLGLAHPPGYPLYTWLGKLFSLLPVGDIAHRMNLMSATLGALAIGGLYLIIVQLPPLRLSGRRVAAMLSALLVAFGPTVWSQAVIAEVYAPNLAFVALTLLCLLRWTQTRRDRDFFLFALAFGLSLGMHLSDLGFAPAFAVFILLTDWRVLRRPKWWLAGLAGFGLGAAQFLWIPLQMHRVDPQLLLGRIPEGLPGLYAYTLGSFSQLKFAFPLAALPERLVVYVYLLRQELGWLAILIGVGGLISLLVRRPRHYFLLVGMYLVHVWFFIQYKVFDLEVFFLPAHFLWAVFVAFGAVEILTALRQLLRRVMPGSRVPTILHGVVAGGVLVSAFVPMLSHWHEADRSADVAANDFYANVWELLPEGSALLTRNGVFGYDAFYWRLVYDTRPDVLLPVTPAQRTAPSNLGATAIIYSTVNRQALQRAAPRTLRETGSRVRDAWMVPVLVGAEAESASSTKWGSAGRLTLYRLGTDAPSLVVDHPSPSIVIGRALGSVTLVGADIAPAAVESGGRVHLVLYWRVDGRPTPTVLIGVDGNALEQHEIGFGNLARYEAEVGPVSGQVVVEDYWLIIPSTTTAGEHALTVGMVGVQETVGIRRLTVTDEQGTFERWLHAAG